MDEKDKEMLIKQLQTELELKNQALYDCERQKKTAEALLLEYQEEIRMLQTEECLETKKLESKIQQLEENNLNVKVSYNERINYLEKELMSKDEEISDLKHRLEVAKSSESQNQEVDNTLFEENAILKEQNSDLFKEVEELTNICETKENEVTTLHEINMQLKEELENYKEILNTKKEELAEAQVINQTLQDKYTCLKTEFDSIKTKPLDDKIKGNSLFAEVDDRRVQLQQNMNQIKTQYLDMKRERANHLKQIAALRNENANLLARWQSEVNEQKDDEDMILQSYINRIRTLNELLEGYKKKTAIDTNMNDGSVKFFDKMLISKNQEIETLKEKISANSLNETILSHDLANARKDIRKYKLDIMKLENDIGQLKNKIEELKLPNTTEILLIKENPDNKSIVNKDCKNNEEAEDEKDEENTAIHNKNVRFSKNTVEPKVTDRSKYRRGGKILESKPVHISSIPKKQ